MKFIDKAKIFIQSGNGGNGCVSFRRERCVPKGGPDGGDGGAGGDIVFFVDSSKETLIDFSNKTYFKAKCGANGMGSNCFGKSEENLIINIPIGTQIWDVDQNVMFYDAINVDDSFTLLYGGAGGLGNSKFASSINTAPTKATKGERGKELWVWLILKIFADIGYIGMPNAGKSSLLRILTNSKTKIADYPFTTLCPELGVLASSSSKLVLADLPGIIQGAHYNKGLGLEFLGHIERCSALLHVIDVSANDCLQNYQIILDEIAEFNPELLSKRQIVALNKIDLIDAQKLEAIIKQFEGVEIFPISCITKDGIQNLTNRLFSIEPSINSADRS